MDQLSDDEISVSSLVSENAENEVENKEENVDTIDSDDEDFVPPPPPPPEEEEDEEDDDGSIDSGIYNNEQQPDPTSLVEDYGSDYSDDDDDDDDDENYLQKLDDLNKKNIIKEHHPELLHHNHFEIEALTKIIRNEQGTIIDPMHKTLPFITKYEKARVLGERAKQLNMGAKPLIEIGPEVIDGYLIAEKEFAEKKIPFIIKRPLPNGGCEYWKFKDLEAI